MKQKMRTRDLWTKFKSISLQFVGREGFNAARETEKQGEEKVDSWLRFTWKWLVSPALFLYKRKLKIAFPRCMNNQPSSGLGGSVKCR